MAREAAAAARLRSSIGGRILRSALMAATSRPAIDLGRLAPDLKVTCGDYCGMYHERLAAAVRSGEGGIAVSKLHARTLDGLLGALCCAADAASRAGGEGPRGRVALVAVGGYGRGLVGLFSDADVLFLCDDPADRHVAALAEGLLYPLWDVGLDVGHVVRGVDETLELARSDLSTATTLLDMRRVAGDKSILDELKRAARRTVFQSGRDRFLEMLAEDRLARHDRFGGSLYLLEPEVKLGCGGLRDLDIASWAAKARWGGTDTESLVRNGALLRREVEDVVAAKEMLWRVRNLLHLKAGRRQDRLTFEDQEEIAVQLGFVQGVTLAVEQFMQAYYRHARCVEQTAARLLGRARHVPRSTPARKEPLDHGLLLFDGQATFQRSEGLQEDPAMALRLYDVVAKKAVKPYPFARDAIARAAAVPEWGERLRADPAASELFLDALTCTAQPPIKQHSVLSELHELGLLLAMVPEFEPVTGRVQHDVYHVYTVDVHSVAAVNRLRAIKRGDYATELTLPSRLAAEMPRKTPLFLGLLLHDIGKAHGKDHSRKGAVMAGPIAERLGLSGVDVAHVVWLVEEHLSLYKWATRRDISDPQVIREIAAHVGVIDRLRDLYLLTVADLSTTNPKAMTSWKARMLEDCYLAVAAELDGVHGAGRAKRADIIRAEVRVGFVGDSEQAALEAFVERMPDRYFLANPVDMIRQHARIARDGKGQGLNLSVAPGPSAEVSELVVAADDRRGLLAHVAAALAAHRLSIAAAQVYTHERPDGSREAFDIFHVIRFSGGADGEAVDETRLGRIRTDLHALLAGEVLAADLLAQRLRKPAWAHKHSPDVTTEIKVDNGASKRFTVVDVFTRDRPALLHTIARTLHEAGFSIAISKVNTEGDKVQDVFYVTDATGQKCLDYERLGGLPALLREAMHAMDQAQEARA